MRKSRIKLALELIAIAIALFFLGNSVSDFRVYEGATVALYVIAICSIILLTGYSGQISLGHGALMAVGAYAAVLARYYWHTSGLLSLIIAVLAGITRLGGAVVGALIIVAIPDIADQIATKAGGVERVSANLPGFITSLLLILTILFAPNGANIGKFMSLRKKKTS